MATAVELEQVEMERFLNILGTMSNIAPLLGLFGTVIGIIRAFAAIARTGSGGSAVVAMGVAEALMTTAAGIIVAVIATVFYNIFVRMIRSRIAKLEDAREEFFVQLAGANIQPSRAAANSHAQGSPSQAVRPVGEPQLAPADLLS
jgi:biopolymer transport protein ExbB/TolQ